MILSNNCFFYLTGKLKSWPYYMYLLNQTFFFKFNHLLIVKNNFV